MQTATSRDSRCGLWHATTAVAQTRDSLHPLAAVFRRATGRSRIYSSHSVTSGERLSLSTQITQRNRCNLCTTSCESYLPTDPLCRQPIRLWSNRRDSNKQAERATTVRVHLAQTAKCWRIQNLALDCEPPDEFRLG